jgi:hypothetical protein
MTAVAGAYITGLFDNGSWIGGPTQQALTASPLNQYVLWALHVDASGNLIYNNSPIVTNGALDTAVSDPIKALIDDGRQNGACNSVYFSIGGWGVHDFTNIAAILAAGGAAESNLFGNLQLLIGLGVDGFDFDNEEFLQDPAGVMSDFSTKLFTDLGAHTSYCPYTNETMWIQALQQTYQKCGNVQPVTAMNLQCYAGGGYNDPTGWITTLAAARSTGVSDAGLFIRPGLAVAGSASSPALDPSQMTSQLQSWKSQGAWLWNSANVMNNLGLGYTLADYGQALLAGVTTGAKTTA